MEIIDWDIINLTNREKIKCFQCGANPSLMQQLDDNIIYSCKNHSKNINTTIDSFDKYCPIVKNDNECEFIGKKM